jgi:ubiquinone biosynthesis protein Coq4
LIFGGLLKRLKTDEPLAPLLHALARGFEVGLSARVVLSFKLEDGWEQPLGEWRQVIGLPAVI